MKQSTEVYEPRGPKVLTLDIETAPLEAYVWSLWDKPFALDRIAYDWSMLSMAWKWGLHSKQKVYYQEATNRVVHEDYDMLVLARDLLDDADIVIGHNCRRFDLRKLRARMLFHGIEPFREPQVADTLLMAKDIGAFTSNKLEYLAENLTNQKKYVNRRYPGFALWKGILDGDTRAWDEMRIYNPQDIKANIEVFKWLRPWAPRMPNWGAHYPDEQKRCPRCGSPSLTYVGMTKGQSAIGLYSQYQCTQCKGFCRTRMTENSTGKRKSILTF